MVELLEKREALADEQRWHHKNSSDAAALVRAQLTYRLKADPILPEYLSSVPVDS